MSPGGAVVALGRGDGTVAHGALDVLALEPGIIGLGDERRPGRVGRDVDGQPSHNTMAHAPNWHP